MNDEFECRERSYSGTVQSNPRLPEYKAMVVTTFNDVGSSFLELTNVSVTSEKTEIF
jgi:hypothetical protein